MSREDTIKSWVSQADRDVKAANDMHRLKHYSWCLFMWHLALEKMLKAYLFQQNIDVSFTHDLYRLGVLSKLPFSEDDLNNLTAITGYNIKARYDDIKESFYKKATKEYTAEWAKNCLDLYLCIKQYLKI